MFSLRCCHEAEAAATVQCQESIIQSILPTSRQVAIGTLDEAKQAQAQSNVCRVCSQVYAHSSSLLRHQQQAHSTCIIIEGNIKCNESSCTFTCKRLGQLKDHLIKFHKKKFNEIKEYFKNKEGIM